MTDKFISDTITVFQPGQTVLAKVTNLDEEKRRFLVTLKMSEVISPEGDVQTRLINGLQERKAVAEMLAVRGMIALVFNYSFEVCLQCRTSHYLCLYSQRTVISASSWPLCPLVRS